METNFYTEWEEVWKSYSCQRDPQKDDEGNDDTTQTSIAMPDTYAHVQRMVARITAQIPNIKFHARDREIAELISRTLMFQWDKGGVQRWQKKHARQAVMMGWSVRAWHWAHDQYLRTKRVDPLSPRVTPEDIAAILDQHSIPMRVFQVLPAIAQRKILAMITANSGRAGMVPIEYLYTAYQGPRCDYLFVGDCYPEPNFQTLQAGGYFIVERRRKREWIEQVAESIPEFRDGLHNLLRDKPNGTTRNRFFGDSDSTHLRERFEAAIDRTSEDATDARESNSFGKEWIFTEMWIPGRQAKMVLVGEDDYYIGEYSPYDLEGKIPFTDCILIDDLLCGVGNSTARMIRGLQQLHDRQVSQRVDLIYNILRPLLGTSNWELYNNPDLVKRGKGFRIVKMRSPNDLWMQGEQAAMAAAAAGLNDESGIMRLIQMATGDSNMSMAAAVDPQQNRTATGARLVAFNQDILTKDANDMFTWSSLNADAEMMYLLNRSEMSEPIEFDAGRYNRNYAATKDALQEAWQKVEPEMFQLDGEIVVEAGSTLADDDESKVAQAQNLFSMFSGHPLINQEKLRDTVLIAFGKGKELPQWAAKPPEPQPETKSSLSISMKHEMMSAEQQAFVLERGLGMPPEIAESAGPMAGPPQLSPGMPPDQAIGAGALAAATGNSPFEAQQ